MPLVITSNRTREKTTRYNTNYFTAEENSRSILKVKGPFIFLPLALPPLFFDEMSS